MGGKRNEGRGKQNVYPLVYARCDRRGLMAAGDWLLDCAF